MDQERSEVGVAPLCNAEQAWFATRRGLPRYEPQPSGEIAGSAEGPARADRGDEGRRVESAEAGDGGEASRCLILAGSRHELGRERPDALVELGPLQAHILDEETGPGAQRRGPIASLVKQCDQILLEPSSSLRDHDPALQEQGAELVDQGRALTNQARSGSVQDLCASPPSPASALSTRRPSSPRSARAGPSAEPAISPLGWGSYLGRPRRVANHACSALQSGATPTSERS